jgi:5S rRNA maturation endonuclease (ribonuclease M5)
MRDDAVLRERCATKRGWKPETLRQLALEGYLGWANGKLAFIYDTGVKLRWHENGERIIRWACGKPWIWRGAYLNFAEMVYLCEGETDAISLIDSGIEEERATVVLAIPSSSTFNPSWADLFRDKQVTLLFDADLAGEKATARISKMLSPVVQSIERLDWKELQHAS